MAVGRIHSYETFGAVDGPGIRFVVFMQGCPLRCRYCHNPDSWDFGAGTEASADEIVDKVMDYVGFYRNGGGVTFSGGEPLAQHVFLLELITRLKARGIHTAIDTAGAVPLSLCRETVDAADMLLLDIKSFDPALSRDITGSPTVLKNEMEYLDYCEARGKRVWVRHVVVPGLTLDEEKLRALAGYLKGFRCVEKIELLPFHKLGEHKWEPGLYTLADTEPPCAGDMAKAEQIFGI